MIDLTVGQVAGIINIAIVAAHLTFPLVVVFVLVGLLKDENNAVTWSVTGRLLNGSLWPSILRTDTAATNGVSKRVVLLSTLSTVGIIFLAGVSVITPLGLSEGNSDNVRLTDFQYAPDNSPIGQGTNSRADYKPNRICGGFMSLRNCPGQAEGWTFTTNATGIYGESDEADPNDESMSSAIPSNLTEIFAGRPLDMPTVAGMLDIQYRSYKVGADAETNKSRRLGLNYDEQNPRSIGTFHMYETLIPDEDYKVVEGLVVDTKTGAVGFRNHTLPSNSESGTVWEENLLFVEPQTVCVDTNLTLDYTLKSNEIISNTSDAYLTDRGGFSDRPPDFSPFVSEGDPQTDPRLWERAYKGALLNNFNLMTLLNISEHGSRPGTAHPLPNTLSSVPVPNRINLGKFDDEGPILPGFQLGYSDSRYGNNSEFVETGTLTQGFGIRLDGNISTISIQTGILTGAATRVGGSGELRFDPGTRWSAPMHACASALKASVKRVSFSINSNSTLSNLRVTNIAPQRYSFDETRPLWAVEDTGLQTYYATPFWGIVEDKFEKSPSLWTRRSDQFYLPAGSNLDKVLTQVDAVAGADAPGVVLSTTYSEAVREMGKEELVDYAGLTNYPLLLKWRNLSTSPDTSSNIINLIWTDIMANYVVSSRSQLSLSTAGNATTPALTSPVEVHSFEHKIQYDIRYAIPAFIFLAFYLAMLFPAFIFWVIRRARFQHLRHLLNQTATGRAVTVERYSKQASPQLQCGTKEWVQEYGHEAISIRKRPVMMPGPLAATASPPATTNVWQSHSEADKLKTVTSRELTSSRSNLSFAMEERVK